MKRFCLFAFAALVSVIAFAQKPVATAPITVTAFEQMADKHFFKGAETAVRFAEKQGQVSPKGHIQMAPSLIQGDPNTIITSVPASAQVVTYNRTGKYHVYDSSNYSYNVADQDGSTVTVAFDGDDVYIQNPVAGYTAGAWVKGTKNGNTITVPLGQFLYYSASYGYGLYITMADVDANIEGTNDTASTEIVYTISGDNIVQEGTSATRTFTVAWSDDDTAYMYGSPGGEYETVFVPYQAPEPVTPPAGLTTSTYPIEFLLNGATAMSGTVEVGIDGSDVYIQGIDHNLPDAWVKGTSNGSTVTFAKQFLGTGTDGPHFFGGYNSGNFVDANISYNAIDDTYAANGSIIINAEQNNFNYLYFYNGLFIGTRPDPVSAPAGLQTVELPIAGRSYYSSAWHNIESTVKVGFDGNDIYVQGLLSLVPEGWVKGTKVGDKYVFASGQYVGNNANGSAIYAVGYDSATGEPADFSFSSPVNDLYISDGFIFENSKNDAISYYRYYSAGLTIGVDEDPEPIELPAGIEVKSYPFTGTSVTSGTESPIETTLNVAVDGKDVYIQGLCSYLPEAWVKGTFTTYNTVIFDTPQMFGTYGATYKMYFLGRNILTDALEDVVLKYDPVNNVYTFQNDALINGEKYSMYYYNWILAGSKFGAKDAVEKGEYTFDFNALDPATTPTSNTSNAGDITDYLDITQDGIVLTVTPSTGNTPNRFWNTNNGIQLRVYGGKLTFAVPDNSEKITKIVFNNGRWNNGNSVDTGTLEGNTWTGKSQYVNVTIAGNTQLNSIEVTVGQEEPVVMIETPWEGATAAEGDFYFYNVESGLWLQNNNMEKVQADWTTRAQVDVDGLPFGLVPADGGFRINPYFTGNHSMNASNLYLDTNDGVSTWTFAPVKNVQNGYTIKSGDKALGVTEDGFLADNIEGVWQLVTKEERMAALANATADEPVNATWVISANSFPANYEKNNDWQRTGDAGGSNVGGDWGGNKNRVFETWNLTECDVFQELEVPNGVYTLQAQGAYSPTDGASMNLDHLNEYIDGVLPNLGWFYANDQLVNIPSIYSEYRTESTPDRATRQMGSYWVPDGVNQVSRGITDGLYKSDVITVNVTDGKLRVGAKVFGAETKTNWIIIDNFRLTYFGEKQEDPKPAYTVDPEEGEVESIGAVTVTFNDYMVELVDDDAVATMKNNTTGAEDYAHIFEIAGKKLYMSFDEITAGGEYTLTIPANTVRKTIDGTVLPEMTFNWTIIGGGDEEEVLVELPAGVEPEDYALTGTYSTSQNSLTINNATQVAFDGNDVYVQGLAYYFTDAWLKGTIQGNQIVFKSPQFVGEDEYGREYMIGYDGENMTDIVFDYDAESKVLTQATSYILENDGKEDVYYWGYWMGATFTPGAPEEPEVVTPPADLQTEAYVLTTNSISFDDDNNMQTESTDINVQVGFSDGEVYIQGLCSYIPDAWVKGTMDGDDFSVASGQYYGSYFNTYDMYFYSCYMSNTNPADLVFTYDAANDQYVISDDAVFALNGDAGRLYYYNLYGAGGVLKKANGSADNGTNGINELNADDTNAKFFDLQGRSVNAEAKGVVVRQVVQPDGTVKVVKVVRK